MVARAEAVADAPAPFTAQGGFESKLAAGFYRYTFSFNSIKESQPQLSHAMLTDAAIRAMVARLDDRSRYLSSEDMQRYTQKPTAETGAAPGVELFADGDAVRVLRVFDDRPAARAGIRPGETLVRIDGAAVASRDLAAAAWQLRGRPQSTVVLELQRDGEAVRAVTLARTEVRQRPVHARMLANDVGYVQIRSLYGNAEKLLAADLAALRAEAGQRGRALSGLIVDLRDNAGGTLQAVADVAGHFVSDVVVVSGDGAGRDSRFTVRAPAGDAALPPELPLVVLVNGRTASGAEALAAALQDHGRAYLIGTGTYGHARIQTVLPLQGGGALALTTARLQRPSGLALDGRGVLPDLCLAGNRVRPSTAAERARPEDRRPLCPPDRTYSAPGDADVALLRAQAWLRQRARIAG